MNGPSLFPPPEPPPEPRLPRVYPSPQDADWSVPENWLTPGWQLPEPPAPETRPEPPPPAVAPVPLSGALVATFAVLVAILIVSLAALVTLFTVRGLSFESSASPTSSRASVSAPALPPDVAAIADKVNPGIVNVTSRLSLGAESRGTGMVLTSSGIVLTNFHVVDGASSITVSDVGDGKTYVAKIVGTDEKHDVAVLQMERASKLKTVSLGDSSKVEVGDSVIALGNALGQGGTPDVVSGKVTALNQSITATDEGGGNAEDLTGLIQTSAALQPGDSGGPLVDSDGKVIGMNTAASLRFRFRRSQPNSSASYAIPINQALEIARSLTGKSIP